MNEKADRRRFLCYLFILFGVLAFGIGTIGFFYYEIQANQIKKDKQEELAAITDLKVREIANWRAERMADAEVLQSNRLLSGLLMQWLSHPASLDVKGQIQDWLTSVKKH